MKALTILILFPLFLQMVFGYEKDDEKSTDSKSFTLDVDDAALNEKVITEDPKAEKAEVPEKASNTKNKNHDEIQTLAGKDSHNGGFGALSFRASEFNNRDIIMDRTLCFLSDANMQYFSGRWRQVFVHKILYSCPSQRQPLQLCQ